MTMPLKNMIVSVIMFVIGSCYLYFSLQLPVRSIQNVPGPSFFPVIIASLVLFLALALFVKGITGWRNGNGDPDQMVNPGRVFATLLWFVLYLVALPYVGFLFASIPFFAGLMVLCDQKRFSLIAAGSILIPVFIYFLFRQGFNILLPAGLWM